MKTIMMIIPILISLQLISCGKARLETGVPSEVTSVDTIGSLQGTGCSFDENYMYSCKDGTKIDFKQVIMSTVQEVNQSATCDIQNETLVCTNGFSLSLNVFVEKMSCSVESGILSCPDGSNMVVPSCSVSKVGSVSQVVCSDGTSVAINDGQDGQNGQDGQDAVLGPYAIVDMIDPCGKQSSYDEILLVLNNGDILAHYSDGDKQHFSKIGDGRYVTTDKTNCYFSVINGKVSW